MLWSRALLSVSVAFFLLNWILEGGFKAKSRALVQQKSLFGFFALFFVPLFGLVYTENISYGLKLVNRFLPFLILPLVAGTIDSFTVKEFKLVLYCLILSLFFNSLYNLIVFYVNFEQGKDYREMSRFISHIRYSYIIVLTVAAIYHFRRQFALVKKEKVFLAVSGLWFILFLFIMQAFSGIVVFLFLAGIVFMKISLKKKRKHSLTLIATGVAVSVSVGIYIYADILKPFVDLPPMPVELPAKTQKGNFYFHDFNNKMIENGHYVGLYLCEKELVDAWAERSSIPVHGRCNNGDDMWNVATRYLTSKGLPKDAFGLSQLYDSEIQAIENGVANVRFINHLNPFNRVYIIVWELYSYFQGMSPEGHSIPQRFEFMKAAIHTFQKRPVWGTGTGDVFDELRISYNEINSELKGAKRRNPHNQIMSWLVSYGVVGALVLFFSFIYAFVSGKRLKNLLPFVLFSLLILSFLNEDTFNTQAGVCMTAYFYSLFLLLYPSTGKNAPARS